MTNVHYLYYDRWIRATYKLLDYVVESAQTWHEMPDYRKHGRLTYLSELSPNCPSCRLANVQGNYPEAKSGNCATLSD